MVDKNYYTVAEVAEILSVDIRSVRRMIKDGTLPALKLNSKLIRIHKLDIPTFQRDKVNDALPREDDKD